MDETYRETGRTKRHVIRAIGLLLSPNIEKKNATYVTYNIKNWHEPAMMVIKILELMGLEYVFAHHLRSIYFPESGNVLFFAGKEETHRTSPDFQNVILDI